MGRGFFFFIYLTIGAAYAILKREPIPMKTLTPKPKMKFTSLVLASLTTVQIHRLAEKELHRRFMEKVRRGRDAKMVGEDIAHTAQSLMEPERALAFSEKVFQEHGIDARSKRFTRGEAPCTLMDYMQQVPAPQTKEPKDKTPRVWGS